MVDTSDRTQHITRGETVMRHYWSRLKRGAIGVAFAATCVSTLNFTGCMKPTGRDLSSDISQDAGQAALEAEREVEERKELEALIADAQREKEEGRQPKTATVAQSRDADAPVRENPLAAFLKRREARDTSDPFLAEAEKTQAREAEAAPKAEDFDRMLASHQDKTPIQRANQHTETGTKSVPDTATSAWDDLLQEHLNRSSNDGNHVLAESKPARGNPITEHKPSHSDQSDQRARPFPGQQLAQNFEAPRVEQRREVQPAAGTIASVDNNKIRVQSLLLTAYAQEGRGDLQAAYRSAVSAMTIADEYGVSFERKEEDPKYLANNLSERLWGRDPSAVALPVQPDLDAFQKPRFTEQRQQLVQRTPATSSAKHDSIFAQQSDSEWLPLPPTVDHSWRTNESPVQTPPLQAPAFERDPFSAPQTQVAPQPTPPPRVEWNQPTNSRRTPLEASHTPEWNSAQLGSRSALAHVDASQSVTAKEADHVEYALAQAASSSNVSQSNLHQLFPTQLDTIESAPASGAELITNEVVVASDHAWPVDESVLSDSELTGKTRTATQPPTFRWGVIGFIIALLSAIIGLRLSTKKQDEGPELKEEREEKTVDGEDEITGPNLRIKRAA